MKQKNALEIFHQRAKDNPALYKAYLEEKKKYHIACKIRECRVRKKLTQRKLAELIGSKQSVISRLENAEYTGHSLGILKRISEVTDEPLDSFLKEKEEFVEDQKIIHEIPPIVKNYVSLFNQTPSQLLRMRRHV